MPPPDHNTFSLVARLKNTSPRQQHRTSQTLGQQFDNLNKNIMTFQNANESQLEDIFKHFKPIVEGLIYYNDIAIKDELEKYSPNELLKKIVEDPYSVIVAYENEELVGFCFNRFDDYLIWLEWIVVLPKSQGQQIGDKIIANLVDASLNRNCHKIWCDSRTSNQKSIKFLTKNGFKQITTIENHWYGQDFILWQKTIK